MKKVVTTITCDHCGKDLSDFGSMPGFSLRLSDVPYTQSGSYRSAVYASPNLSGGDKDFCNMGCLKGWIQAGEVK